MCIINRDCVIHVNVILEVLFMSLDIKGNILRDNFYNSIYGQKVLIIYDDNPSMAYDISKQGFDVTVLTDNNQMLSYKNFKVEHGEVFAFQTQDKFDTVIVGNKVGDFANLKFLFQKVKSDLMHADSRIIFIYDTEIEIENFVVPKILNVKEELLIDNFDMNTWQTFISLGETGKININYVLRKIESVLTYKLEQTNKEIQEVAKLA